MSTMLDPYTKGGRPRKPAQKSGKSKSSSGGGSSSSSSSSASFLFVVNELCFYTTDRPDMHRDMWHNVLPPRDRFGYTGEIASRVMRYQSGEVTEARGYQWYRPGLRQAGYCVAPSREAAECYSHAAVFSCNPHLPVVVVPGDPMTAPEAEQTMHALHFFHPSSPELRGVSQATTPDGSPPPGGFPLKYVAGRNPSWIPGLVPPLYTNPRPAAPSSHGLGGELPIVLGLMAFSDGDGRVDEVYLGRNGHRGRWRDRVWTGSHRPSLYPESTQENPHGFYIAVFYDPQNPEGSTFDRLRSFEWNNIIVREHPPSSSSRR